MSQKKGGSLRDTEAVLHEALGADAPAIVDIEGSSARRAGASMRDLAPDESAARLRQLVGG